MKKPNKTNKKMNNSKTQVKDVYRATVKLDEKFIDEPQNFSDTDTFITSKDFTDIFAAIT